MLRRMIIFSILVVVVIWVQSLLQQVLIPQPQQPPAQQFAGQGQARNAEDAKAGQAAAGKVEAEAQAQKDAVEAEKPEAKAGQKVAEAALPPATADGETPQRWITLGSGNAKDPYRMLVTLTTRGATLVCAELNSPNYRDQEDRSGYLGHLVVDASEKVDGCPVQMVAPGTPAAAAGLRGWTWEQIDGRWEHRPGDVITAIDGKAVSGPAGLDNYLANTRPKQKVRLKLARGDEVTVELGWRPMAIVQPEVVPRLNDRMRPVAANRVSLAESDEENPYSLRMTLAQLDDAVMDPPEKGEPTVLVGSELKGLDCWTRNWELVETDEKTYAKFLCRLGNGVELEKTFRLATVPAQEMANRTFKAYHLDVGLAVRNAGDATHKVAYQFDGPNGLPTEGFWYALKVSHNWSQAGMRDVIVSFENRAPTMINCPNIARGDVETAWSDAPLNYLGVDAQYFSGILVPQKKSPDENWLAYSHPLRVGQPDPHLATLTNTSVRLVSKDAALAPGEAIHHEYELFLGPKKRELLDHYQLGELLYYGWFSPIAKPLVVLLHLLFAILRNYGLAIILLTVIVRGGMFPLSRKQAISARKMAELQPEMKRLRERYKKDMEGYSKAQRELFRKHNHNPYSGCLVIFIQLPIFMALYRTLQVDIDLRQAPLLSEGIRWCSNLAAPDMLYDWSALMPPWVNLGHGMLSIGPYLNLLPILTIFLFIGQQKAMMPPPTDEQQAMQQKMMKWMMILMGVLFFKVPSGLCIYFIASAAWSIAERQFLPKSKPIEPSSGPQSRADIKAEEREAKRREEKAKKKKKPE